MQNRTERRSPVALRLCSPLSEPANKVEIEPGYLTQQGRRILPELRAIAHRNDHRSFDCLSAGEKATLGQMLPKLTISNEISDVPVE